MSNNHTPINNHTTIGYDKDTVKRYVTARQVAEWAGADINGKQSTAFFRNGDNKTAILYNDDGTYHDFVEDKHGDAIQLYRLWKGCDFAEAVNALGNQFCPQEKLVQCKI